MKTDRRSVGSLFLGGVLVTFSVGRILLDTLGFEGSLPPVGIYGSLSPEFGPSAAIGIAVFAGIGVVGTGVGLFVRDRARFGAVIGAGCALALGSLAGLVALRGAPFSGLSVAIVALGLGGAVAFSGRSRTPRGPSSARTQTDPTAATASTSTAASRLPPDERIGVAELERLEPVAPEAVADAREQGIHTSDDVSPERIETAERKLRRAVRDALTDGPLDLVVTADDGTPYEIVNLPTRFREIDFPTSGHPVHVRDVEDEIRESLESEAPIRDIAAVVEAVREHRDEIESYVREGERSVVSRRTETEANLEAARDLLSRFDGEFGAEMTAIAVEDRHSALDGVFGIERRLETATRSLHRCAFEDAQREVDDAYRASERLVTTVDFLSGLVGTVEHGGTGSVSVPESIPKEMLADIRPLIERQYGVDVELTADRLRFETTDDRDEPSGGAPAAEAPPSSADAGRGAVRSDRPEEIFDEVLYVLRELERTASLSRETVEYQTDRLPASVAHADVIDALSSFCRRQTDVVAAIEVQEGAPPGFLEIEFTDRTDAKTGAETLHERYIDAHDE